MIHLYYWTAPNGHKITIYLAETTPYSIKPINIGAGDQFAPEFLAISPNNRIPAIVDDQPEDGGAPLSIFEWRNSTIPRRENGAVPAQGSARPG